VDPSGHKVVFSENQYDYLKGLENSSNSGLRKWARQQLDDQMAYIETKTGLVVSGCFDCVHEDNSPIYDVLGGVAGVAKGTAKAALKAVAKELTQAVVKQSEKKILWTAWKDYNKVNVDNQTYAIVGNRLYSRHAVDRMQPSSMRYTSDSAGGKVGASRIESTGQIDYGRGVAPQYVEDVINSTKPILQANGNLSYTSGSLTVILTLKALWLQ
jgi:hypothetical protein